MNSAGWYWSDVLQELARNIKVGIGRDLFVPNGVHYFKIIAIAIFRKL